MRSGKGWFETPGRPGDRSLQDQLKGLDWVFERAISRTVLDIGCAEGLISIELAKRGAAAVHGVEIVPEHVAVANRLRGDLPVTFEVGDANTWRPRRQYDIVLCLALLHKLRDPSKAARGIAMAARSAMVLRMPPVGAPKIVDERSGFLPHDIGSVMHESGFELVVQSRGHFNEWVGVYLRDSLWI